MIRTFSYAITESDITILSFLKDLGYSRHVLTTLKHTDHSILKNNEPAFTNATLNSGDVLTVHLYEPDENPGYEPVNMDLNIIYEDQDILVVNKPANMPIHPSINNYNNTLANGILWHYLQQGICVPVRCINRLDRDTTGLVLVAKHKLSAAILSSHVKKHKIHRSYLALVQGVPPESGSICAPMDRQDASIITRCVDFQHGAYAKTNFKRLKTDGNLSLLELKLETGRTHQIRVHMKYLGYPLPGDFLYNPDYRYIKRQALHSYRLEFIHPITKQPMQFYAPLPEDMDLI